MDTRGGTRQGLPWDAAQDLLFLAELSIAKRALAETETTGASFAQIYAQFLARARSSIRPAGEDDPWADPLSHGDVGRMGRGRSKPPPLNSRSLLENNGW